MEIWINRSESEKKKKQTKKERRQNKKRENGNEMLKLNDGRERENLRKQ